MGQLIIVEALFGWIYFFAWSAAFYPQVSLVFRRKHTGGFSPDHMAINIVGFVSYTIFTFTAYYLPPVSASYEKRVGSAPQVEYTDVLFAAHGALMCSLLIAQMLAFPPRTPPLRPVSAVCVAFFIAVLAGLACALAGILDWYEYLQFSGGVKVLSSLVKHIPQVLLNRARQNTIGWSYTMVLLDVTGGLFSMAQQTVRCFRLGSTAPFTANLPKTFLALESIAFDIYFILQHVVWYTNREDIDLGASTEARHWDDVDEANKLTEVEAEVCEASAYSL